MARHLYVPTMVGAAVLRGLSVVTLPLLVGAVGWFNLLFGVAWLPHK
jgi:hypothetical protein